MALQFQVCLSIMLCANASGLTSNLKKSRSPRVITRPSPAAGSKAILHKGRDPRDLRTEFTSSRVGCYSNCSRQRCGLWFGLTLGAPPMPSVPRTPPAPTRRGSPISQIVAARTFIISGTGVVKGFICSVAVIAATTLTTSAALVPTRAASDRVALVIGNGAYQSAAELPNPPNDAADVAKALRRVGFEVVEGRDLVKSAMENRIREFGRKLDKANIAILFYAGHGLQVGGKNYLVPIDAKLERAGDLNFETIEVGLVLAQMEADNIWFSSTHAGTIRLHARLRGLWARVPVRSAKVSPPSTARSAR